MKKNIWMAALVLTSLLSFFSCGGNSKSGNETDTTGNATLDSLIEARLELLKEVNVENIGQLVAFDMKVYPMYEEPSKSSAQVEGYRGPVSIYGPALLSFDEQKDGWFKVGDPLNNAVGWVRGDGIRPAQSKVVTAEQLQALYYNSGWWEHVFVGVNEETGLAVGYRLHRGTEAYEEVMLGKVVENVFVFHYFMPVKCEYTSQYGPDFMRGSINSDGVAVIQFGKDRTFTPGMRLALTLPDLTKLPAFELAALFEEQIGQVDDWNFNSYFFVNSEMLNSRFAQKI